MLVIELGGNDERGVTGVPSPVYTKIPEDTLRNEKQRDHYKKNEVSGV